MRLLPLGLALFAALALASPLEAQRRCTKGIPCGNSCIAAGKTCRKAPAPAPSPPATPDARPAPSDSTPSGGPVTSGPWVASRRGTTYYKAGCSGARDLAPANRIYFRTEADAQANGYRRSRQAGC